MEWLCEFLSSGEHEGMKADTCDRQPCSPNFVQARDAIIDADTALTKGANKCEIWKGFAKRGLGTGARYSSNNARTASTALPADC
jgi:extracellular elastinolytic metalloproteinase